MMTDEIFSQILEGDNPLILFADSYEMHRRFRSCGVVIEEPRRKFLKYINYRINHGPCPLTGGSDRVYQCEIFPGQVSVKMTWISR